MNIKIRHWTCGFSFSKAENPEGRCEKSRNYGTIWLSKPAVASATAIATATATTKRREQRTKKANQTSSW